MELASNNCDTPQADFLWVVERVLGPQFDESGKQVWWCEESDNEVGFNVTDGKHTYLYSQTEEYAGIKRVWFQPDGRVGQMSIRPFRSPEEDYPNNRAVA